MSSSGQPAHAHGHSHSLRPQASGPIVNATSVPFSRAALGFMFVRLSGECTTSLRAARSAPLPTRLLNCLLVVALMCAVLCCTDCAANVMNASFVHVRGKVMHQVFVPPRSTQ